MRPHTDASIKGPTSAPVGRYRRFDPTHLHITPQYTPHPLPIIPPHTIHPTHLLDRPLPAHKLDILLHRGELAPGGNVGGCHGCRCCCCCYSTRPLCVLLLLLLCSVSLSPLLCRPPLLPLPLMLPLLPLGTDKGRGAVKAPDEGVETLCIMFVYITRQGSVYVWGK